MKLKGIPLDKYQLAVLEFIEKYAISQAMPIEDAVRDVLGDIRIICQKKNIDFDLAVIRFDM